MQHPSLTGVLRRYLPRGRAAAVVVAPCEHLRHGRSTLSLSDPPPRESEVIYRGERRKLTHEDWERLGFEPGEAVELAGRTYPRLPGVSVAVLSADGAGPLEHYPFHSPAGFEWGYEGSGPADLARCLLLHYHAVTPTRRGHFYPPAPDELPVSYQAFKWDVIARLPQHEGWTLTRHQITEWIEARS
jgi:hypothetical protein